jgi:hypothetical protein
LEGVGSCLGSGVAAWAGVGARVAAAVDAAGTVAGVAGGCWAGAGVLVPEGFAVLVRDLFSHILSWLLQLVQGRLARRHGHNFVLHLDVLEQLQHRFGAGGVVAAGLNGLVRGLRLDGDNGVGVVAAGGDP